MLSLVGDSMKKKRGNVKETPSEPIAETASTSVVKNEPRIQKTSLSQLMAMAHKKNPKEHDIDEIIASFGRFDFVAFPTIDEATQVMVAGHGRCEALQTMKDRGDAPPGGVELGADGEWMVPIVRGVSFRNEHERDAYVIADNQNVIKGGWKFDALTEMLQELESEGGFEGIGFDQIELASLLEDDDIAPTRAKIRKQKSNQNPNRQLEYKLVITCRDERHQAELMERFEIEELDVKVLIV